MAALNELEKLYKKPAAMGEQMANSPTGAVEAMANPDNPNAPQNPNQPPDNQQGNQQKPPPNPPVPPKGKIQENLNPNAKVGLNTQINTAVKAIREKMGI
jgi:hypothetical protein